jgi:cytochrome c-type biogenesis protein CcmH/NrfG
MAKASYCSKVLNAAEVQLLTEIGLMACGARNTPSAKAIFEGLRILRPNEATWLIGLAMSRLEAGLPHDAVAVLENSSLLSNDDNADVKVFLAMSLIAAGRRSESARVLNDLLAVEQADSPARQLARGLLHTYATSHHLIAPIHAGLALR